LYHTHYGIKYANTIANGPIIINAAVTDNIVIHINHSQIGEDRKIKNNPNNIKVMIPYMITAIKKIKITIKTTAMTNNKATNTTAAITTKNSIISNPTSTQPKSTKRYH